MDRTETLFGKNKTTLYLVSVVIVWLWHESRVCDGATDTAVAPGCHPHRLVHHSAGYVHYRLASKVAVAGKVDTILAVVDNIDGPMLVRILGAGHL